MSISLDALDRYVAQQLSETRDDADAAFPRSVRIRTLQEAVLAIARGRPDLFSERIVISAEPDSSGRSFVLPDQYDRLLEIQGIEIEGDITSLAVHSESEMMMTDDCWQHAEQVPTHAVWSPLLPRYIRVNGAIHDAKIHAVASRIDYEVNGDSSQSIPLSQTYFPAIVDMSLARLRSREDTSAPMISQHMSLYAQAMAESAGNLGSLNPLVAYRSGISDR